MSRESKKTQKKLNYQRAWGSERMKCQHLKNKDKINTNVVVDVGNYAIEGCCGRACYTIWGIVFCPFCGERLINKKEKEVKE